MLSWRRSSDRHTAIRGTAIREYGRAFSISLTTTTYAQRTGGYVAYESVESNEICAKPKE